MSYADGVLHPGMWLDGRWEIGALLGRGGFGEVFKATQRSTGQAVAIKVLTVTDRIPPDRVQVQLERFRREMRLCGQLHHPNIVRLIDSGEQDGRPYTVFEYIPGKNLADVLAIEGPLEWSEAAHLMGQVLDALSSAHRLGIVHRDMKPHNIMLTTTSARRNAMVLDFGVSALFDSAGGDVDRLTGSNEWVGTPAYAAPEQLTGHPATPKSDLFAWGLVFAECLTGQRIIGGGSVAEILASLVSPKPVEIPRLVRDSPFGELLTGVVQKDVGTRDLSARDVLQSLELTGRGFVSSEVSQERAESRQAAATVWLGAGLAPDVPIADGEKRQVTALCAHLAPPGRVDKDVDPDEFDAELRALQLLSVRVANECGGFVESVLGDRVLTYFGFPQAGENDASRAAKAALVLLARLAERGSRDGAVEVRLGIHTGLVVVRGGDQTASGRSHEIVGTTPTIAFELASVAEPFSILVTETTRNILKDQYVLEPHGPRRLSGIAQPVRTFGLSEVESKSTGSTGILSRARPMVGRAHELNLLVDRWEQARGGTGQAVLITGEPGIGKSRLAGELTRRVTSHHGQWLECRCTAEGQNAALHPFIDLLGRLAGLEQASDVADRVVRLEAFLERCDLDLAEAMPLLGGLLALPTEPRYRPLLAPAAKQKELTLDNILLVLSALAAEKPALLVVEDLHWSDPTTRALLDLMTTEIETTSLCAIFTARPGFEPTWSAADVLQVQLGRLTPPQIQALVASVSRGKAMPDAVIDEIVRRTDGVALFVEELATTLLESSILEEREDRYVAVGSVEQLQLPSTLRGLLTARLDRVGSAKRTAQLAAVAGREFTLELLETVARYNQETLRAELTALESAGIVIRRRRRRRSIWVFKHALIRDAAYASILIGPRRRMHADMAFAISRHFAPLAEERPDLLAHHHAAAGQRGTAIGFAQKAGMAALMRSANAEAIAHATQALEWLEGIDGSQARAQAELGLNGVITPALMAEKGYTAPELAASTRRSQELLELVGDSPHTIPTLFALATYHHVRSERPQARAMAERFLAHAERSGDAGQVGAALPVLAQCLWIEGDFTGAQALVERAIPLYDPVGHAGYAFAYGIDSLAYAQITLGQVLWGLGRPQRALDLTEAALRHGRKVGHANTIGMVLLYLAMLHHQRGERAQALAVTDSLVEICQKYGLFYDRSFGGLIRCWAGGDSETARQILAFHEMGRLMLGMSYYRSLLAESLAAQGEHEAALTEIDRCMGHVEETGERYYQSVLLRLKGECLLALDRAPQGRESLEAALQHAEAAKLAMPALQAVVSLYRSAQKSGGRDLAGWRERLTAMCQAINDEPGPPIVVEARALIAMAP